jgi:tripartite-type tricarboxylate transporter receptor subunit TctC
MKLARRKFLRLAAFSVAWPAVSRVARAQTYPSKSITMRRMLRAGSPPLSGNPWPNAMRNALGQRIIIENVGAADGGIGTGRAARARSDGYTISIGTIGTNVLNGAFCSLQYDVLNDFAPVVRLVAPPNVLFASNNAAGTVRRRGLD